MVRDFWSPFQRAIVESGPRLPATDKVRLMFDGARTELPDAGEHVRSPPPNLIDNADEVVPALKQAHAKFRKLLDRGFDKKARLRWKDKKLFRREGVVMVAGGEYFGPALVSIMMLRKTGSWLPVEIFLAGYDEYEKEICDHVLPTLNSTCFIISDFMDPNQPKLDVTRYQLKSLAMLFSSFNHMLYLDSDTMPLVDPMAHMILKEPYISHGLIGWPDFWRATESPLFYDIAGLPSFPSNLPPTSSEAGQLLVDKSRHLKTLLLSCYYNIWGPSFYYPLLSQGALGQGDKNTFETAATVLGLPWYRVRTPVKSLGRLDAGEYRGSAMVQFHPTDDMMGGRSSGGGDVAPRRTASAAAFTGGGHEGASRKPVRPAFVHANTPKMNGGHLADEGDLVDKETGEPLRLWGPPNKQLFGKDIEKEAFRYVIESACLYQRVLKDWSSREGVCKTLMDHYQILFYDSSI
jgi:alpha 1,2-mannosyltransferase